MNKLKIEGENIMSFILSINAKTKRKECELGDIVAVYDFEPTSTEKELFDITEVAKVKAEEIMNDINKDIDPEKDYPKFKGNLKNLSPADKNKLKDNNVPIEEIRTMIKKIKIKDPLRK